ncbi:hypothetical protein ABZ464_36005 [Streptomyces sp. NPDC005820]|uniref:hypothetical protein n=1 Tax=Streptomyces sp. NPDC005820 TaxID=3157069 RepID=UPI00340B6B8B
MGRVGRKFAGVQVTSRLTWTFSARLGRSRGHRSTLPAPASAAGRKVSVALLRTVLAAARRPRPLPPAHRPPLRARRRRVLRRRMR